MTFRLTLTVGTTQSFMFSYFFKQGVAAATAATTVTATAAAAATE